MPLLVEEALRVCMDCRKGLAGMGGTGGTWFAGCDALSEGRRCGLWEGVVGEDDGAGADTVSAAPLPTSSGVKGCAWGVYGETTPRDGVEPSS
jgi:hypothetical protein